MAVSHELRSGEAERVWLHSPTEVTEKDAVQSGHRRSNAKSERSLAWRMEEKEQGVSDAA